MNPRMPANDNTPAPFLTIAQVAQRWRVHAKTVRRLIARGDLAVHRIGGQIRIALADLVAYERLTRLSEAA